jgi:hypothetical protein
LHFRNVGVCAVFCCAAVEFVSCCVRTQFPLCVLSRRR